MGWFPGTVPQGGNTLVVPEGTDELGGGTEQAGDGGNAGVGTKKGQDIVKDKGKGKWVLGGQLGKANTVVPRLTESLSLDVPRVPNARRFQRGY
jgi:hypothetical protein